jgi:hypothetical protein
MKKDLTVFNGIPLSKKQQQQIKGGDCYTIPNTYFVGCRGFDEGGVTHGDENACAAYCGGWAAVTYCEAL